MHTFLFWMLHCRLSHNTPNWDKLGQKCVHSDPKRCLMGYGTGALVDLWDRSNINPCVYNTASRAMVSGGTPVAVVQVSESSAWCINRSSRFQWDLEVRFVKSNTKIFNYCAIDRSLKSHNAPVAYPQYTTSEQKCAHSCSNVVHCVT